MSSYFMYIHVYVMKHFWFKFLGLILAGFAVSVAAFPSQGQVWASGEAQSGVVVTVTYSEPINVRGGPSTVYYPIVGRVSPGDVLPALGVSPGNEWVQISFPGAPGGVGWVYAAYVTVSGGELRVVEPPPTPTPLATATINPTFAAAFISHPTETRMPTFTPPPPLTAPHYTDESAQRSGGLASGAVALSLLVVAIVIYLISLAIGRR
ncbi:SH3 domain-containing protein [Chloroflexi bacterium CFX6]|nr:SH3 domain-containing protein [Chloroflexi bacterium CFX6]